MSVYLSKDADLNTELNVELTNEGASEGLTLTTKVHIDRLGIHSDQGITVDGPVALRLLREMMHEAETNGWLKPGSVMLLMSQCWPSGHDNPTGAL